MGYNVIKQAVEHKKEIVNEDENIEKDHALLYMEDIKREAIKAGHVVNMFGVYNILALYIKDDMGREFIYQLEETEL